MTETTVALTPGPITVTSPSALVVGSGNQLADSSDATYAEITTGTVQGDLTHYAGPTSTDFGYSFRSSVTGTAPCAAYFDLYGTSPDLHFLMRMGGPDGQTRNPGLGIGTQSGSGAIVDWFADYGLTAADFLEALRRGVRVVASTNSGTTLRVYEFALFVTYQSGIAPPLRQFPRSDGLAVSSARRMWPPSRSYQRGIRRAGGYL